MYSFIICLKAKKLLLTASGVIVGGCSTVVVEITMLSVALGMGVEKVGVPGAEVYFSLFIASIMRMTPM
jgi:hypothetical protein